MSALLQSDKVPVDWLRTSTSSTSMALSSSATPFCFKLRSTHCWRRGPGPQALTPTRSTTIDCCEFSSRNGRDSLIVDSSGSSSRRTNRCMKLPAGSQARLTKMNLCVRACRRSLSCAAGAGQQAAWAKRHRIATHSTHRIKRSESSGNHQLPSRCYRNSSFRAGKGPLSASAMSTLLAICTLALFGCAFSTPVASDAWEEASEPPICDLKRSLSH